MRKSYPKADLSANDISLARQFIQFAMKIEPEFRPSAEKIKEHLFLKTVPNTFAKDCFDDQVELYPKCQGAVSVVNMEEISSSVQFSQDKGIHPLFFIQF